MHKLSFSIVINTYNRGSMLQKTLESLRWLRFDGAFEVVVVNGPSTDNSEEVIASWLPSIRTGKCDVANISVSRNIGISMAQGDIVAFIDDDAIPEPEWLIHLAKAYDTAEIGGAGGIVFDETGHDWQFEYCTGTRLGNANWKLGRPSGDYCYPASFEFPYLQGTNASFRRSALLEVGGFDEEFEYYLDETDLCCRLVDAGYVLRQLQNAFVHHKSEAGTTRDEHKTIRYRYPIIKNKIYFSLKHCKDHLSLPDIFQDNIRFSSMYEGNVELDIQRGRVPNTERERFIEENQKAWQTGVSRGLSGLPEQINDSKLSKWKGDFCRFVPIVNDKAKTVVLVSCAFPPRHAGGIAVFSKNLAEALAQEGNCVHVITKGSDIDRVDFENGVWIHRMVIREKARSTGAIQLNIPQYVWNWSTTALEETRQISTHHAIDVVEAPIWNCEGAAFLLDGRWPLVTSIHTTLYFWIESYSQYKNDAEWMTSFANPMLGLERELMTMANGVRANSRAIVQEIERAYDIVLDRQKVQVILQGIASRPMKPLALEANERFEILFVGRLERRKGIDVLLSAIPRVLEVVPKTVFRIVGDNSILGPEARTYKDIFLENYANQPWIGNVQFQGYMSDEQLQEEFGRCAIFVAPSRFESFGLVLLEAMREGKPVIGCVSGVMPEVVSQGINGLLVEPGNVDALTQAILRLIQDTALRTKMGGEGRRIFQERFTSIRMAKESFSLYELAKKHFQALEQ